MRHEGPIEFARSADVAPPVAAAAVAVAASLEMAERSLGGPVTYGRPAVDAESPSTAAVDPPSALPPVPHATFIADGTVPDGDVFPSGARFTKSWRLRNAGSVPFGPGAVLRWTGGDDLSSPGGEGAGKEKLVGWVGPGEPFEVAVEMQAPERAGRYIAYFRLSEGGREFGERVWAE